MELFRYSRNVYGQQVLEGISFDLIWLFIGAATTIIIGHLVYKLFGGKAHNPDQPGKQST
jgi:hypothetical protein